MAVRMVTLYARRTVWLQLKRDIAHCYAQHNQMKFFLIKRQNYIVWQFILVNSARAAVSVGMLKDKKFGTFHS